MAKDDAHASGRSERQKGGALVPFSGFIVIKGHSASDSTMGLIWYLAIPPAQSSNLGRQPRFRRKSPDFPFELTPLRKEIRLKWLFQKRG